ncbi:putative integral membrane protein conserved region-domain-containing protein [Globomyces pollinis-pini]|nr:putative integral membrane protein conserved region-domain-containing protein [Globomyces pollinis-pini]
MVLSSNSPLVPESLLSGWMGSVVSIYSNTISLSSFLISRFLGDDTKNLITDNPPEEAIPSTYQDCFGVLQHKTLYLYTDENKVECCRVILIPQYKVSLYPDTITEHEYFIRNNPIALFAYKDIGQDHLEQQFYFYCQTSSEKETWFIILRRAAKLPAFADAAALSSFYHELDPMKQYVDAMKKLVSSTTAAEECPELTATAWLNALVGRMFVSIHANKNVANWVTQRLSRHNMEDDEEEASFLGTIVIQDVNVGNSLPVLSNPKLVNISVDGDMLIEMDIEYTGGVRLEASSCVTLSVPAWDAYMKPIIVPIVVAVKIKTFSARLLLKIKPFWESNRIWFGFYRQPELKLELEVEPIISNKLIKIQMVNQVIEQRIKKALEAYVMLPNMDDLSFWDFTDLNGSPFANEYSDSDIDVSEVETMKGNTAPNDPTIFPSIDENSDDIQTEKESFLEASMVGEALESNFESQTPRTILRRQRSITKYIEDVEKHLPNFSEMSSIDTELRNYRPLDKLNHAKPLGSPTTNPLPTPPPRSGDPFQFPPKLTEEYLNSINSNFKQTNSDSSISDNDMNKEPLFDISDNTSQSSYSYTEYLGDAAYTLGNFTRKIGLDSTAKSVASSVAEYAQPAVEFAQQQTQSYKQIVQDKAANLGLTAIEKLGLAASQQNRRLATISSDNEGSSTDSDISKSSELKNPKKAKLNTWSVLGLNISTSAPSSDAPIVHRHRSAGHSQRGISVYSESSFNSSQSLAPWASESNLQEDSTGNNETTEEPNSSKISNVDPSLVYMDGSGLKLRSINGRIRDQYASIEGDLTPKLTSFRRFESP